jgi:hypothetical protein
LVDRCIHVVSLCSLEGDWRSWERMGLHTRIDHGVHSLVVAAVAAGS